MTEFLKITDTIQFPELEELAKEIWSQHYAELLGQEQIDYMLEKFQSTAAMTAQLSDGYRYYLLLSHDFTAGYMGIQIKDGSLFLSKLYLRDSCRGRGIAKDCLAFLMKICKEERLSKIWLTVNRHNDGSVAAYKKMGFITVREQDADIGHGYVMDDYIMEMIV